MESDNIFGPENVRSFEFGSRNRFLENRLQVNFGLFHWKYTGLQDQRIAFDPLGLINLFFFNVGDATIKGATLDVVARATSADTISGTFEYADSHYDSFLVQVPTVVFLPGASAARPRAWAPTRCRLRGISGRPRLQMNRQCELQARIPARRRLDDRFQRRAEICQQPLLATDFIPAERGDPYGLVDASLTYNSADKNLSISAFVRNIGQKAYYTGNFEHPFVRGLFVASTSAPRAFGRHHPIPLARIWVGKISEQ